MVVHNNSYSYNKTFKDKDPDGDLNRHEKPGYILVDFDRTLAVYDAWETQGKGLGAPVPTMVERIAKWRTEKIEVRIFTARASKNNPERETDVDKIREWCLLHLGCELPITNEKDFLCMAIYDDIAVSVEANTGHVLVISDSDPLSQEDEMKIMFPEIAKAEAEETAKANEKELEVWRNNWRNYDGG